MDKKRIDIFKLRREWASSKINSSAALRIYTFPFLSHKTRNLVRQEEAKRRTAKSFLIIFGYNSREEDVLRSLMLRIPVFFGSPRPDMFDETVVEQLLGFTQGQIERPDVEYVLAGQVTVQTPQKDSTAWVLHTWGINLESKTTQHYKKYVLNGHIEWESYNQRTHAMVRALIRAAEKIEQRTSKPVIVVMPYIGAGAFLNALSDPNQIIKVKMFLELAILNVLTQSSIRVILADYKIGATMVSKNGLNRISDHSLGNLFNLAAICSELFEADNPTVCLVNAWDNESWIGNGGARDSTVDGQLVSGCGSGSLWINSSFLHNPFLSTSILDKNSWFIL